MTQSDYRPNDGGYSSPREYYVARLQKVTLVLLSHPNVSLFVCLTLSLTNTPTLLVVVSTSSEENPMLDQRCSRYISEEFRDCFALECEAKRVRNDMGLTNVEIMIPFVRTLEEGFWKVIELLEEQGLKQGENGLRVIMMCELPSNALLADEFLDIFDGFSIGSNDLTQLTLGLDRDSGVIAHLFDERNEAVKKLLAMAIQTAKKRGKYVGICGQGPSDHPDFAAWLVEQGIDSVSLNPDTVIETWMYLSEHL